MATAVSALRVYYSLMVFLKNDIGKRLITPEVLVNEKAITLRGVWTWTSRMTLFTLSRDDLDQQGDSNYPVT